MRFDVLEPHRTSLPHSSSAEDDISLSFTLASGQAQIDSSLSGAIHT